MNVKAAPRAAVLVAGGLLLRDCTLLAAGLVLCSVHVEQRLDAAPDRSRAWLCCVLDGLLLLLGGSLLAAHTAAVFFGWLPMRTDTGALASAALLLVATLGGLAWREITVRHVAAVVGWRHRPPRTRACQGSTAPSPPWSPSSSSSTARIAWDRRPRDSPPRTTSAEHALPCR